MTNQIEIQNFKSFFKLNLESLNSNPNLKLQFINQIYEGF